MHRTFSVPRLLGWSSLLCALMLQVGVHGAAAQNPIQPVNPGQPNNAQRSVIELPVGTSRAHYMTTRTDLKRVENPNSSVVRVERIADKNNEILLVAENPGRTMITFVDQKDRAETHEIVVTAAQGGPAGESDVQAMSIVKGTFKTARLKEVATGGISNENSKVVRVIQSKDDLKIITFEALDTGRSRVVFYYGANKERSEVIDITVIGPETKGVHLVQLEVVVAVVNRSAARNMSFSFLSSNNNWFVSSLIGGPATLTSALATGNSSLSGTGGNIPFGVLNSNGGHTGFLQALRTEGLTKILAEPRLTTISGKPARIQSGGNVQIVAAGGVSSAQISADFGTIVDFLPIVLPNGKIQLDVAPEVSTPTNAIPIPGAGGAGVVSFSVLKRAARVTVQLEDGQTLAIGGLIQNRVDSTTNKVPIFGDIPLIGAAFRSVNFTEIEEEMIILVTPRLVDGVDCTKIPKYLPGRETRVPDDFELFLEGISEAPRRPRNVIFHPHYYKGAYHGSSTIGQYPCADGSCHKEGCTTCGGHGASFHNSPMRFATPAAPPVTSVPGVPTSSSRVIVEPESPGAFPPIREIPSGLGTPTAPGAPLPPGRQQDSRPSLPPLTPISR